MNFGTENVDVDNNSATPYVTFPTVALNPTADYEQFALNQSVKFTIVLKDKDATGAITSKVEVLKKYYISGRSNASISKK